MVAHALPPPNRDFRGPGCTEACQVVTAIVPGRFGRSELLLHDPEAHEEYGRVTSWNGTSTVVWTGALVVDLRARSVTVYGREPRLSMIEWRLLEYLALNLGRICGNNEMLTAVWGPPYMGSEHLLRITICRLRIRLGSSGSLIENVLGRGYRLIVVDAIEGEPSMEPPPPPWTRRYAACVECGRSDSQHVGKGVCARCRTRERDRLRRLARLSRTGA